jgi:hypothetical protein
MTPPVDRAALCALGYVCAADVPANLSLERISAEQWAAEKERNVLASFGQQGA